MNSIGNPAPLPADRIGLGCMGFSWGYSRPGQLDDNASVSTIREAFDAGIRHFDTSDMYGAGHNEELVGKAFANNSDVYIATKGGIVVDSVEPLQMHVDGSTQYLRDALDASLRRLNRDHVDLYYLHRLDGTIPVQEQVQVLADAQAAGKIRSIGVSEPTYDQLVAASEVAAIDAVQSELSVWTRDPLKDQPSEHADSKTNVLQWCEDNGASLVAFSPLGRGYLTGTLNTSELMEGDFRSWMPRFTPDAQERNAVILETLQHIAEKHEVATSQVALAWVLSISPAVKAIPGSRSITHIVSNFEAANVLLDADDIAAINDLPEPTESRY